MIASACRLPAEPLGGALAELGIKTGTIVTRNSDEQIKTDAGSIDMIPAWRFLLDLPESAA